jgi:CHC2 zinc finger/Toprim domain
MIELAKAVPLEAELARRGAKLRRVGRELVGPCPVCGGTDRFAVNVVKQIWNCRGCQRGGDVIDLVQHIDDCSFPAAIRTLAGEDLPRRMGTPPARNGKDYKFSDHKQSAKASWLWARRQPIAGSVAETYLREVRGISCPLPKTLAFLPARSDGQHPAMIGAFAPPAESEPGVLAEPQRVDAIHLTLLRADSSGKADVDKPKLFVGRPLGRPIALAPIGDMLALAVTEGIEDGLSLCAAFDGLGVWAAGSAGRMPALADTIPRHVENVTIWAHPDVAGQNGARKLAELVDARGIEVLIEGAS